MLTHLRKVQSLFLVVNNSLSVRFLGHLTYLLRTVTAFLSLRCRTKDSCPAQRRMANLKRPSASGDISSTRLALASCSSRTSPLPRTYGASRACLASLVLTGVFWVIRPLAGLISEGSLDIRRITNVSAPKVVAATTRVCEL